MPPQPVVQRPTCPWRAPSPRPPHGWGGCSFLVSLSWYWPTHPSVRGPGSRCAPGGWLNQDLASCVASGMGLRLACQREGPRPYPSSPGTEASNGEAGGGLGEDREAGSYAEGVGLWEGQRKAGLPGGEGPWAAGKRNSWQSEGWGPQGPVGLSSWGPCCRCPPCLRSLSGMVMTPATGPVTLPLTECHQDHVYHGTAGAQGRQRGLDVAKAEAASEWPLVLGDNLWW